ncbi:hypothetical protein P691DRAFT_774726 [Macrolepiota fuliginosa MF-IS2]|uniref:DUF6533 domain-containing protein n=1 Tax=Macrolepiota fuliginosa MF-IS2 TaxID=1400762 RepID=A0A9P5XFH5_9AGAR|nr:hypothetical protein P691DRAFT_774726 [Macrolepiota fuliginosa MF-IS2]
MATTELLQALQELTTAIGRYRNIQNLTLASAVIMILDWLLTLEMEVTLIWEAEWNLSKGLYMVSRYMPFIDVPIALTFGLNEGIGVERCKTLYTCIAWMFCIGEAIADLIFTLRTWVVWGKLRRVALGLAVCYIATWVVILVTVGLYLRTAVYMPSPVPQLMGCIEQSPSVLMSVSYIAAMVYNAIMLVLILIPGVSAFKSGLPSSGLMRVIYSDGVIYYVYIFVLSFLNFFVIFKLPKDYINLLLTLERVLQSVLSCRVILHIRQQAAKAKRIESQAATASEILFR